MKFFSDLGDSPTGIPPEHRFEPLCTNKSGSPGLLTPFDPVCKPPTHSESFQSKKEAANIISYQPGLLPILPAELLQFSCAPQLTSLVFCLLLLFDADHLPHCPEVAVLH